MSPPLIERHAQERNMVDSDWAGGNHMGAAPSVYSREGTIHNVKSEVLQIWS